MQNRSLRRQVAAAGALELFCEFEQPLELAKTVVDRPAQIRVDQGDVDSRLASMPSSSELRLRSGGIGTDSVYTRELCHNG